VGRGEGTSGLEYIMRSTEMLYRLASLVPFR